MHSTDEALRMRGQLPAIPSTATVHQTIQTVSRELRLILEIPRPAERQFVSFEIAGHRQGRAGNLFYNRSDRPWFHELPALTVATSMHAGELYQYNPYVTIYLLAETHVDQREQGVECLAVTPRHTCNNCVTSLGGSCSTGDSRELETSLKA